MVEAWKEEDLSFEVPGRIEWVVEKGNDVQGSKNAYTVTHGGGELIAALVPEEYELKLKAAEANIDTAQAKIDASRVNIKEVVSRQLDAAKADMENAEKEFKRFKFLLKKKAISQKIYDKADTTLKKNQAKYNEIKALIIVREAELKGLKANLEQLEQAAADAKLNIKRTKLRAPYQGKIVDIFANIGANVKAGEKVAKLVVMDPVVIKLNVSPELDRKFHYCQFVNVYPPGTDQPIPGMVNKKTAIADPNTHTFSLELLVRNRFMFVEKNIPDDLLKLPEIGGVWPVTRIKLEGKEKHIVVSDCVYQDDKGDFLWKIQEKQNMLPGAPVYTVKKERVVLLPGEHDFLGVYKYRILASPGSVKDADFVATGVPENVKTGEDVILIRKQRMFRPGDLVKVVLSINDLQTGFYIPIKMISSDSLKHWVFKVVRLQNGSSIAKQVFIKPKGLFNDWVRIESPELKNGAQLVFDGAHFLVPNEKINVKSIEQVTP
jgi:multidrug efflux pump subunit AcrA (membrane-fusion protein)